MIPVRGTAGGAAFRVHASAGAAREGVLGVHGEALKVAVRAAPERGRANRAICELVALALGVRRGDVRVVAGQTARDKTVEVAGLDERGLISRLQGLVEGEGGPS